jgi:hypothetical protein
MVFYVFDFDVSVAGVSEIHLSMSTALYRNVVVCVG